MKTVEYRYVNTKFTPDKTDTFSENGLSVNITPVDAASINREVVLMSAVGGNYEKESYNFTEFLEVEEALTAAQRASQEMKINCIKLVNKLISEDKISYKIGRDFFNRIVKGQEFGMDGSEVMTLARWEDHGKDFNPYYLQGAYLSVFKVKIENLSNAPKVLYRDRFQVLDGEIQLTPFSDSKLFNPNSKYVESYLNLQRMNLPDSVTVAPKTIVTKYFGVPGLAINTNAVVVNYITDKDMKSVSFNTKLESVNKQYEMRLFSLINAKGISKSILKYSYVVEMEDGNSFALNDTKLYLESGSKMRFKIHTIASKMNGKEVFYAHTGFMSQPSEKSNTIELNFSKAEIFP